MEPQWYTDLEAKTRVEEQVPPVDGYQHGFEHFVFDGEWLDLTIHSYDDMEGLYGGATRCQISLPEYTSYDYINTAEFVFQPMDWTEANWGFTFFTWHSVDDAGEDPGRSGPIDLQIFDSDLRLVVWGDPNPISINPQPEQALFVYPISLTEETKIRMVYKPSWLLEDNPFINLYINNVLVYAGRTINAYNDENPPYAKFGPYQWSWDTIPAIDTRRMRIRNVDVQFLTPSKQSSYFLNPTSVADRNAEQPSLNFTNGLNLGASNAIGIGIGMDIPNILPSDWTLLDQNATPRTPQFSSHIGETGATIGIGTPSEDGDGSVTVNGDATLDDLPTGWTAQ